jgi:hypothetical protein
MESIIARALEYTLKYWLKSFSRDQFKLQGRTAQLSNLGWDPLLRLRMPIWSPPGANFFFGRDLGDADINGDALHASLVLPPSLAVETARVGKLQITVMAGALTRCLCICQCAYSSRLLPLKA